ncbi:hypothetical protein EDB81DRAFT_779739 [Dactylonectria macrodidyma]|uniref:Uncharacterized protein n=1 Tax=Dactylonectria macrodidyma TaxID=307937 RepID=A0A9P9FK18_9HYPO|nr:hypothetical protein EDB81DRAFT_779739 [Dactylonectria macrodidyma]
MTKKISQRLTKQPHLPPSPLNNSVGQPRQHIKFVSDPWLDTLRAIATATYLTLAASLARSNYPSLLLLAVIAIIVWGPRHFRLLIPPGRDGRTPPTAPTEAPRKTGQSPRRQLLIAQTGAFQVQDTNNDAPAGEIYLIRACRAAPGHTQPVSSASNSRDGSG